jgi:hypothetical protein
MILFYFRALRDLRGESSVSSWVAALPHWVLRDEISVSFGCGFVAPRDL